MQISPKIVFHGMDPSPAVEAKIMERIEKLEEFHSRIVSCRVTVSAPHRHSRKGKIFQVRIDIGVPGRDIIVNREPGRDHAHEDVYIAIRDAFNAANRQLEDHFRKRGGIRIKEHAPKGHGKVARLFADEGYGFVATLDGRELFFERDNVTGDGWRGLDVGSEVRFTEMDGEGGPHATAVTAV